MSLEWENSTVNYRSLKITIELCDKLLEDLEK